MVWAALLLAALAALSAPEAMAQLTDTQCRFAREQNPSCVVFCPSGEMQCFNGSVGIYDPSNPSGTVMVPMAEESDDAGRGPTAYGIVGFGILLVIVLLFIANVIVCIIRFLRRERMNEEPPPPPIAMYQAGSEVTEGVPATTNAGQKPVNHILFVNPGGSLKIGREESTKEGLKTLPDSSVGSSESRARPVIGRIASGELRNMEAGTHNEGDLAPVQE